MLLSIVLDIQGYENSNGEARHEFLFNWKEALKEMASYLYVAEGQTEVMLTMVRQNGFKTLIDAGREYNLHELYSAVEQIDAAPDSDEFEPTASPHLQCLRHVTQSLTRRLGYIAVNDNGMASLKTRKVLWYSSNLDVWNADGAGLRESVEKLASLQVRCSFIYIGLPRTTLSLEYEQRRAAELLSFGEAMFDMDNFCLSSITSERMEIVRQMRSQLVEGREATVVIRSPSLPGCSYDIPGQLYNTMLSLPDKVEAGRKPRIQSLSVGNSPEFVVEKRCPLLLIHDHVTFGETLLLAPLADDLSSLFHSLVSALNSNGDALICSLCQDTTEDESGATEFFVLYPDDSNQHFLIKRMLTYETLAPLPSAGEISDSCTNELDTSFLEDFNMMERLDCFNPMDFSTGQHAKIAKAVADQSHRNRSLCRDIGKRKMSTVATAQGQTKQVNKPTSKKAKLLESAPTINQTHCGSPGLKGASFKPLRLARPASQVATTAATLKSKLSISRIA